MPFLFPKKYFARRFRSMKHARSKEPNNILSITRYFNFMSSYSPRKGTKFQRCNLIDWRVFAESYPVGDSPRYDDKKAALRGPSRWFSRECNLHTKRISLIKSRVINVFLFCSLCARAWVIFRARFPPPAPTITFAAHLIHVSLSLFLSLCVCMIRACWKCINRGWLWCRANSYVVSILSFLSSFFPPPPLLPSKFVWRSLVYFTPSRIQSFFQRTEIAFYYLREACIGATKNLLLRTHKSDGDWLTRAARYYLPRDTQLVKGRRIVILREVSA